MSRPYSFIAPYVAKADSLGDAGLSKIDDKVPIVKEDTKTIQDALLSYAHFPVVKAGEGKTYLLNKYNDEYKKCGGNGYVASAKAVISTSLLVGSDGLDFVASWLGSKKEQTKELAKDKTRK